MKAIIGLACCVVLMATTSWSQLAPTDPVVGEEEAGVTSRASRFQRAPFKTYTERLGPQKPQKVDVVATVGHSGVVLRQLDKMTGGIQTIEVTVGDDIVLDRLRIRVAACRTPDDDSATGAIALMQIWDVRSDRLAPDFSGWMFAESPALSALDHPRYDVWVLSCITTSGGTTSSSE